MRKIGIVILLIAMMTLSACAPAATSAPTAAPTNTPLSATATPTLAIPTFTPTDTPTVEPTNVIVPSGPATCKVIPVVPTPDPTAQALLPTVSSSDWTNGSDSATINVIEYGDFQSAASAQLFSVLAELQKKYPDQVRLVFRNFPLYEQYDKDNAAAQAVDAAGAQGKFWQYAKLLYTFQSEWISLSVDDFTAYAYEKAAELGLNADQFKKDMLSDATVKKIANSRTEVVGLMQAGTLTTDPYLFFNSAAINPPYSLESLSSVVAYLNLSSKGFSQCPPMTVDPSKTYTATLHTEKGDIVLQLYADKAPWAVNSFIYLAQQGWYDGSGFFRVIPGFMAQAGDPSNSGMGNPGYTFSDEFTPDLRFDKEGVVGMANSGADSNGSQFFITYAAVPSLDGKYTVFGKVTSGMEVLRTLRPRDPSSDALLLDPDPILSITIEVK